MLKLKDFKTLPIQDYDLFSLVLSKYNPDLSTMNFEDLKCIIKFLETLWLSTENCDWTLESKKMAPIIENIGKSSIKIICQLVGGLNVLANKLAYPSEIKWAERHLFQLYEIFVSPLSFLDRTQKFQSNLSKINLAIINKLFINFAEEIKGIINSRPAKKVDEFLQITQKAEHIAPNLTIHPALSQIMEKLQLLAAKDFDLPKLWLLYFESTLNLAVFNESPMWNTDKSRSGWNSFNICILVLEEFGNIPAIAELKKKLIKSFYEWSHKALDAVIMLLKESDSTKTDLITMVCSGYIFPICIFYGYLTKENNEASIIGTEFITETIQKLLEINLAKVINENSIEPIFSNLYFLFSFMCKQVGKHMMSDINIFSPAQKYNYIELSLKLFDYISSIMNQIIPKQEEEKQHKGGIIWEIPMNLDQESKSKKPQKVKFGAPKSKPEEKVLEIPQEALDSLEEIVAMLGCLIGNSNEIHKKLVNAWIGKEETIKILLRIISSPSEVHNYGIYLIIGKLVMEITQKDACYDSNVWIIIGNSLINYTKENSNSNQFNGYLVSLLLKLALCCHHKLEQNIYTKEDIINIKKLWINIINILLVKQVSENREQYKEISILFLLQTILKPDSEHILADLFLNSFKDCIPIMGYDKYYELFLKLFSALPLEMDTMKICSDILSSILLKGIEPDQKIINYENLDISHAFNTMSNLALKIVPEKDAPSLMNLLSIKSPHANRNLISQLLKFPDLIKYTEDTKMLSTNYYLNLLLSLLTKSDQKQLGENLQENMMAIIQCYMGTDLNPSENGQFIYLQSVLHSYIFLMESAIQLNIVLPSPQDILEFINMACDHAVQSLESVTLNYFDNFFGGNSEFKEIAGIMQGMTLIGKDLKNMLSKIKIPDFDSNFLEQISGSEIMKNINKTLYDTFISKIKSNCIPSEAIVDVFISHFHPNVPENCLSKSLFEVSKCIISTTLLIQALIKGIDSLLKIAGCLPQTTLQAVSKIDSILYSVNDHNEISKIGLDLVKAFSATELVEQNYKNIVHLQRLSRICQTISSVVNIKNKPMETMLELLLEQWEYSMNEIKITKENEAQITEITGCNLQTIIQKISVLLTIPHLTNQMRMDILQMVFNCIEKKNDKLLLASLKTAIPELKNENLIELFKLKYPTLILQKILSNLISDSGLLQEKIFTIIVQILQSEPENDSVLLENLKLLSNIIELNRDKYLPEFISKIMPVANSTSKLQLQSLLFNYMETLFYNGFSIEYPREAHLKQPIIEPGDDFIEGYGVENFSKKEEPPKSNAACSYFRTRRKNDPQPVYYCFTCGMTESKVCCSACIKVCHKGHKVAFAKIASIHCVCHNEYDCLIFPKDADLFENDHSSPSYYTGYKKYGGFEYKYDWSDDRPLPPAALFGMQQKVLEASRVRDNEKVAIKEKEKERKKSGDNDEDEDDEDEQESSESADIAAIEESEESPEKSSEEAVASTSLLANPAVQSLAPKGANSSGEGQKSVSEESMEDKQLTFCEATLPPRDVPYEKIRNMQPTIKTQAKLVQKDANLAQNILVESCKNTLKNQGNKLVNTLLDNLKNKSRKTEFSNEKFFTKTDKVIRNSNSIANAKIVFDIMPPASSSKKVPPPSLYSDAPASLRSYLSRTPTARGVISVNKCGLMAVAFRDHVNIYNSDPIANEADKGYSTDKTKIPPVSKIQVNFAICSVKFNECNDSHLAIAGIRDCIVVTLDQNTGQIISKLVVDLMLQAMGDEYTITKIAWLPKSQVHLAVAAHLFVKIYDLSADNIAPICTLNASESDIKDMCIIPEENSFYRFFLTCDTTLVTASIDINSRSSDNNIELVDSIEIAENVKNVIKSAPLVSAYYASKSKLLYVTTANAKLFYGELKPDFSGFNKSCILSLADDLNGNNSLFDLHEFESTENCLLLTGLSNSSQLAAFLLKIEENDAHMQILKQKIEGVQILEPINPSIGIKNTKKILTPSDDAYVGCFALNDPVLPPVSMLKKALNVYKLHNDAKLIDKGRLPSNVSMPFDHFEKAVSILDPTVNLSKKVKVNGTISLLVGKDNVALYEWLILGRGGNQFPVGIPFVTCEITLDAPDYVICGIRILADTAPKQFCSIFNRKVQLGNPTKNISEIGFCDAEILSIENNMISFKLEAEETPIKLKGIEVYVLNKDTFGYTDKIEKLESALINKGDDKNIEENEFSEILSTKMWQVINWSDKEYMINLAVHDMNLLKSVATQIELFSIVCYNSDPLSVSSAEELLNLLSEYLYIGIEDGVELRLLRSSARKCAKAVIHNVTQGIEKVEGDKFNYRTYKCNALFNHLVHVLKDTPTFEAIAKYIKCLSRVIEKSKMCFFEKIGANLETLAKISVILLESLEKMLDQNDFKKDAEIKNKAKDALQNYILVCIAYYDYLINSAWREKDAKKSPHLLIKPNHIERVATMLGPYMLTKNEEIKSLLITVFNEILPKHDVEYIHTCQTPVMKKYRFDLFAQNKDAMDLEKPFEFDIRSFDFSYILALSLCKYILDRLGDDSKCNVVAYALMKDLFTNYSSMATYLRMAESKSDEDWALIFQNFVETTLLKKNVSSNADKEIIFLGLKLFNILYTTTTDSKKKSTKSEKLKQLGLDAAARFMNTIYQNTNLTEWIGNTILSLYLNLKDKKGEAEPMQDIGSPEKKAFLKKRSKSTKSDFASIFSYEDTMNNLEMILFQEITKLAYNLITCEQFIAKSSKNLNIVPLNPDSKSLLQNQSIIKSIKDILCEALLTPGISSNLDQTAQKLFKGLSKNKGELNQYKDNYTYSLAFKILTTIYSKLDKNQLPYDSQVNICKQLSTIWKIAKERPVTWRAYIKINSEAIRVLLTLSSILSERIAFQALGLVCLALENDDQDTFNVRTSYEILTKYPPHTVDILDILKYTPISKPAQIAENTIICQPDLFQKGLEIAEKFGLESGSLFMRVASAHLIRGLLNSANDMQKEQILKMIRAKITPEFYKFGGASLQMLTLCLCIFQQVAGKNEEISISILNDIINAAKKSSDLIERHENSEIYREVESLCVPVNIVPAKPPNSLLSSLPPHMADLKIKQMYEILAVNNNMPEDQIIQSKEFLYCLEEVPCNVCISDIGQPFALSKINDIKEDSKFTDSCYLYKLSNSYSIQKLTVRYDLAEPKYMKTINIYVSNAKDTDLMDLRGNWGAWKKTASQNLKPKARIAIFDFPIPITTSLLMIEFIPSTISQDSVLNNSNSYRGIDMMISSGENVLCPRCMRMNPSMHGICTGCGENIMQCPHCHSMNYDKMDSFICNECGHTRFGKIDISISARLGFATQKIANEKERSNMQYLLSNTLSNIMKSHEILKKYKAKLESIVNSPVIKSGEKAGRFIDIHDIYMNNCVPEYKKLVKLLRNANSIKSELLQYSNQYSESSEPQKLEPSNNCYGCAETFIQVFMKFVELAASIPICKEIFKKQNIQLLMFEIISHCNTPSIAKLFIKSLVSLGINDSFFADVIITKLQKTLENMKNLFIYSNKSQLRSDIVLSIELLIKMHSKLSLLIIQKTTVLPIHLEIFTKINSCLWKTFSAQFPIKNSICAEEIIQPILNYILQLLMLPINYEIGLVKSMIPEEQKNIFEIWNNTMKTDSKEISKNLFDPIIAECILNLESKNLRETASKMLKKLCEIMPNSLILTITKMLEILPRIFEMSQETAESFMWIFKILVSKLDNEQYKGKFNKNTVIQLIMDLSQKELDKLLEKQKSIKIKEDGIGCELWIGYSLYTSLELVFSMLNNNSKESLENKEMAYQIIKLYTKAKKLLTIANNYIDKSITVLESLFMKIPIDTVEKKKSVMLQCLKIANENKEDEEIISILYSELYKIINPEIPEPKYLIILQKAATQEMFIRGNTSKSPYQSNEIGTLMRDIRTKICKDLDIRDGEQLMELLVGNKIIELDLPIKLVYEKVWWPFIFRQKNPEAEEIPPLDLTKLFELEPMVVIYRIAGVDGEATEDRIENLGENKEIEDPEIQFASASVFVENLGSETKSGIEIMLDQILKISNLQKKKLITEKIIKLLNIIAKLQICRKKLVQVRGINILAAKLIEFLPAYETSEGYIVDELILILENIITEANKSSELGWLQGNVLEISHINKILQKLIQTCEKMIAAKENITKPGKYVVPLTKILPYFAYGSIDSVNILVAYFKDWIKFNDLDETKDPLAKQRAIYHTSRLTEIIESIPSQISIVRDALLNSGVTQQIIDYIKKWINVNENEFQKCQNGLQTALKLLIGIFKDHKNSQLLIVKNDIIQPIYKLSLAKTSKGPMKPVELLCEIFIEEIVRNSDICKEAYEMAQDLIKKTKEEKRIQAEKKKAEIMAKMKLQKTEGMLKPKVDMSIFGETKVEEEKGFSCIVCHEGYKFKPNDILGAYVYGKNCDIRNSENFNEKYIPVQGVSNVTHFNLIHLSCHMNAVKAEKSMKQPKSEWEGATIRNSHTKCNNWIPIRGGSVTDGDYMNAMNKYFSNMRGIIKNDLRKSQIVANDIKFMLKKFAYEENFSHYSHGGGPIHNIQLLPFMIQLALFLNLSGEFSVSMVDTIISAFFTTSSDIEKEINAKIPYKIDISKESEEEKNMENIIKLTSDDFCYIVALMLITYRYNDWANMKQKLLNSMLVITSNMVINGITAKKREKKGTTQKILNISESVKITEEKAGLAKIMKEIRPLLILMVFVELFIKAHQITLLSNGELATKEEYIKELYGKLSVDLTKVNEMANNIFNVYNGKVLEFGTVEEFLGMLGAPKETLEQFINLSKIISP